MDQGEHRPSEATRSGIRVEAGAVVALRSYHVAYAIDLARVEALGSAAPPGAVARIRLTRAEPKAITFDVPPVGILLGPIMVESPRGALEAEATARVYDFGVVSLALRLPFAKLAWAELADRVATVDEAVSAARASALWNGLLQRVRDRIAPAMERPSEAGVEEDYLLTVVQRFEPPLTAEDVLREADLAPILLPGERQELSDAARRDLLRHRFSYYRHDLAVVSWDSAFLVEPAGDADVADVLEVATAQLLELRYYDELLDQELPRMYDRIEEARGALSGLSRRRYANLARDLHTLVAEVTEITERVDNALKVTEDVYLARIYGAGLDLFRVPSWASSVHRKLAIIRETYTALYDEAATVRLELLEVAIVLLIIMEIVLAFVL